MAFESITIRYLRHKIAYTKAQCLIYKASSFFTFITIKNNLLNIELLIIIYAFSLEKLNSKNFRLLVEVKIT